MLTDFLDIMGDGRGMKQEDVYELKGEGEGEDEFAGLNNE